MKEIKTVTDDPEFIRCNDAVQKCEVELLAVADRNSAIELEVLKATQPNDNDEWSQFKVGGVSDTSGRSRVDSLRREQSSLQDREQFLIQALEQGRV